MYESALTYAKLIFRPQSTYYVVEQHDMVHYLLSPTIQTLGTKPAKKEAAQCRSARFCFYRGRKCLAKYFKT